MGNIVKYHDASIQIKYLLMVVAGAFLIAINAVITKVALTTSPTPISGTAVTFTVGLIVMILIIAGLGRFRDLPRTLEKAKLFLIAGIFMAAAFIFYNLAFLSGTVSVVFPLIGTQPLFVLLFSWLLLKQSEKLTKNIILGTIMIVVGAALLSLI